MTVRGRLAPSPTGALHLGNARSFLIAWLSSRSQNGKVVLRMEDLDHPKVKPGTASQAMNTLRRLGLDWDEGPDVGGPQAPYTQSKRISVYRKALERLIAKELVYSCVCTRRDVEAAQSAPHAEDYTPEYPGHCRDRFENYDHARKVTGESRLPAWRFKTPSGKNSFVDGFHGLREADVSRIAGDFVIARHPDGAGYQLAVTVDDALMGINEVVRGDDLLACTHWQLHLYEALGYVPPRFIHVPLVVGPDGKRLAKRHGDTRIDNILDCGISPGKIVGLLAWWCGWAEFGEELLPEDLIPRFDLRMISSGPVVVDADIRKYLNL